MHIPALRLGKPYASIEKVDVIAHATGEKLAEVSQVNAGIVVRDLPKYANARETLRKTNGRVAALDPVRVEPRIDRLGAGGGQEGRQIGRRHCQMNRMIYA